ncbi:hypothetical protein GDO81_017009 [Engystomops pustulosus]|uniref:Uncharacterized protein n=1 Tax=Engystomops pustulosus TaxID=76066 RepID=A0AAV7AAU8_ENGPU|nr:hypothetical protein GDO81_017009 [Engystomops pustulosus]
MTQKKMDFRVIFALGIAVTCGVEGCPQPLALYLSPYNSLHCRLCVERRDALWNNNTFTLTQNGKVMKLSQGIGRKIWYTLDDKKDNTGLWRCHVQGYRNISAEYYLGPPTPTPPAGEMKDSDASSVPDPAMSPRTLLTIMTVVLLLALLIIIISLSLGVWILRQRRSKSASHQHHKGK